ncbi:MAG: glycoside hydrolase family 2 protein [Planctomycetota bacterium]|jgi:beta-galactosidase/beta-glucuronidase
MKGELMRSLGSVGSLREKGRYSFLLPLFVLVLGPLSAEAADRQIPRPEHPKPQFHREAWLNLNGQWNFAFDFDQVGVEQGWAKDPSGFDRQIVVPFCPESKLSGIQHTGFIPVVWYHRTFTVPDKWDGMRIFLHFGAVDYDCRAWVNGSAVGRHYGGSSSFCFEITATLHQGRNDLIVCALDDVRSDVQPAGKQSRRLESHGVMYTRTTGIWQTVWLEARPRDFIESVRIVPDLDNNRFVLTPVISSSRRGLGFRATLLSASGKRLSSARASSASGTAHVLEVKNPRPWSPADPYLYKLRFELNEGNRIVDSVNSYAGLRKFHIEGNKFYLNNKPIFLRHVLDQGFYPDGIWTAPSDAELKADIELSMAVGFNGARLHQKVFEERFHYWADRLGYLTWGEFCDWGGAHSFANPQGVHNQQREWREVVMRDLNHPSILAWTPFNETRGAANARFEIHRRAVEETVALTRALDPTRPINDCSGYVHVETDIFTVHDYDQNPETFRQRYASVAPGGEDVFVRFPEISAPYEGQPYSVDEYGGTFWTKEHADKEPAGGSRSKWGYGKTAEQVEELIGELTRILTDHPHIAGYCYTQLTDVEQEVNGIYTYDRKLKFNAERLKKYFGAPAAIEKSRD